MGHPGNTTLLRIIYDGGRGIKDCYLFIYLCSYSTRNTFCDLKMGHYIKVEV
jgi:hypothetical protein